MSQKIGAIGIDFGSSRSVIGVAKRGGVDILDNEANYTETPNCVSYTSAERFLGNVGQSKSINNFKNTVCYANRLLGVSSNYPNLNYETQFIPCNTSQNQETGEIQFEVNYANQQMKLSPEQVTAAMFTKLKNIITKHGLEDKEAVVSVPDYFTEQERKALIDAAKIADLNITRVFNESSAIATSYGIFRKSELDELKPRYVAFVDFGHSKFSAFIAKFTKDKLKIISQINDRNLGARDIDLKMFEFYANLFEQNNGVSLLGNKKSKLKLFEAIKNQRKVLGGVKEASINLECLMEDYDLSYTMKREQFEQIATPVFQRVQTLLQSLTDQISQDKEIKIHSVEAVGGAFRIPAVKKIICDTFKVQNISLTLNASECIAKGCAMMAAMNHPQLSVTKYQIEEQNLYPINISWSFSKPGQMEVEQQDVQSGKLFSGGQTIPNLYTQTFKKLEENVKINCYYEQQVPGFSQQLASFEIAAQKSKEQNYEVKARIKQNKNGLIQIQDVTLCEEFLEEEKRQIQNQNKQDSPKFETATVKKTRETQISYKNEEFYSFSQKKMENLFQIESEQKNKDNYIKQLQFLKYELETYLFKCRSDIQDALKDYIDQNQILEALNQLQAQEDWLNDEDTKDNKQEYTQRIEQLKQIFEPVYTRYRQYQILPENLSDLIQKIKNYEIVANSQNQQSNNLNQKDRQDIIFACNQQKAWIQNAEKSQKSLKRFNDPVIKPEDVLKAQQTLIDCCEQIVNKANNSPKKQQAEKKSQKDDSNKKEKSNGKQNSGKMEEEC